MGPHVLGDTGVCAQGPQATDSRWVAGPPAPDPHHQLLALTNKEHSPDLSLSPLKIKHF